MRFSVSDIAFATLHGAGTAEEATVDVACGGVARHDALGGAFTSQHARFTVRRTVPLVATEEDTRSLLCTPVPPPGHPGRGFWSSPDGPGFPARVPARAPPGLRLVQGEERHSPRAQRAARTDIRAVTCAPHVRGSQ